MIQCLTLSTHFQSFVFYSDMKYITQDGNIKETLGFSELVTRQN